MKKIMIGLTVAFMAFLVVGTPKSNAGTKKYRSSESKSIYVKGSISKKKLVLQGGSTDDTNKAAISIYRLRKAAGEYSEGKRLYLKRLSIKKKKYAHTCSLKKLLKKDGLYEIQVYIPNGRSHFIFLQTKKGKISFYRSPKYTQEKKILSFVKKIGPKANTTSITNNSFINTTSSTKMTKKETKELTDFTNRLCKKKKGKTDYEKAQIIYDWICKNIYYNQQVTSTLSNGNNNPYFVFKKRFAVCEGYVRLYTEMLHTQNIPAVNISGVVSDGRPVAKTQFSHAYVLVYGDHRWFYADPTWDCNNRYNKKKKKFTKKKPGNVFFDQSLAAFSVNHRTLVAETGVVLNGIPVTIVDGQLTATTYQGTKKNIVYPRKAKGLTITGINSIFFKSEFMPQVASVTIPEGYRILGSYAFQYYTNMHSLYLPNSITKIKKGMLFNSAKKTTVYARQGSYAYKQCQKMNYKRKAK